VASAVDGAHATDAQLFFKPILFVECVPYERIDAGRARDGGISLQRRLILRTNLKVRRVLPSTFRAMKHMKPELGENADIIT
jgi:hypothetical protein